MVRKKRDYFHKVKRHSGDEEYKLQCDIIELFKLILKKSVLFTAFPAGGGGKVRGAKLKKMGLVAGWPDIQILADGKYFGVEVKTPTGRISPAQRTLHLTKKNLITRERWSIEKQRRFDVFKTTVEWPNTVSNGKKKNTYGKRKF